MGSVTICSMECLPDDLFVQILSFLTTKEAASTSVLSKRWRTLFALSHNLDFDNMNLLDTEDLLKHSRRHIKKSFNDFVDHTLALHGNNNIKKFSLELSDTHIDNLHDVDRWICNALERGVSDLHLGIESELFWWSRFPSKVFTSTTLVKLSLGVGTRFYTESVPSDLSLPALKVLFLDSIIWLKGDLQLLNVFLAACPALEDLTIRYMCGSENPHVISSKTIKKLSFTYGYIYGYYGYFSRIISFDTPNVVDFYYSDYFGSESPQCHLDSIAKATLDLHFLKSDKIADVTDLISGIRNVKTLHLNSSTVKVISICCKGGLPVFNNLVDLVFFGTKRGWKLLLPLLLERSPNLKNLVLSGLDCFTFRNNRFVVIRIPPTNQIKMLSIKQYQGSATELKHICHFLMNMECLEVVKVYVAPTMDDPKKMQLTEDILKLPTASSKVKIQVM
ncbi:F-box-like domain superfamily [Arabidopsis thaliana x Arabidopsis arenosa]|uniref:F-box-like domain superfamily n=1 Tax=Arabidopsis thaliana x Arabidopsis arenosa TaxID=1240361 RepID=A0A8T1ZN70_9BRAS|nr:F-box-like domain superfamily [Arabidopsis thaliana x Arabidopsis arenosa]